MFILRKGIPYLLGLMVVLIMFSISDISFARQGAPGSSPTVEPMIEVPKRGGSNPCDDAEALQPLDDMGRSLHAWSRSHGGSCCWKCLANCYFGPNSNAAVCIDRCQNIGDCD